MAKTAEGKAPVKFLKSGTAYGYGYAAGEFGLVDPQHLEDYETTEKRGEKEVKVKHPGLLPLGIVQKVDMAEVTKFNAQYEKR